MKLARLDLTAFGHFVDKTLDFPQDGPGFHLIVGPNEAGKTTTLHAVKSLLFGFDNPRGSEFPDEPFKNDYSFQADANRLKVGATLVNSQGESLSIVRTKARGKAKVLLASDGKTEIDASTLKRFLPGLSEPRDQGLYLTTYADMVDASKRMVAGTDETAMLLFMGGGMTQITRVLPGLKAKYEELYKESATARNPPINNLLLRIKEAKREAKDLAISATAWKKETDQLKAAEEQFATLDAEIKRIQRDSERLKLIQTATPLLARRAEALRGLDALGEVKRLRPDLGDEFKADAAAFDSVELDLVGLKSALNELDQRAAAVPAHDALLVHYGAIADLEKRLSAYRKTVNEHHEKLLQRDARSTALRRDLDQFHPDLPLEEIPSLRLPDDRLTSIRNLSRKQSALAEACRKANNELEKLLALADSEAVESHDRGLYNELADLATDLACKGDLDERWRKAVTKAQKSRDKHTIELQKLPLWDRSIEELISLKVPSQATIDRFKKDWDENLADRKEFDRTCSELKKKGKAIEKLIKDDDRLGGEIPPTEGDLAASRLGRDEAWSEIKSSWIDGKRVESPFDLATRFEELISNADSQVDEIRKQSGRVQKRAQWIADLAAIIEEQDAAATHLTATDHVREALESAWNELWKPCGIMPLPPAEMTDWLTQKRNLIKLWEPVETDQASAKALKDELDEAIARLRNLFEKFGQADPVNADLLASWLASAQRMLERSTLSERVAWAKLSLAQAEAGRDEWQLRWDSASQVLGLGAGASLDAVDRKIEAISELINNWTQLSEQRNSVSKLQTERESFEAETREIAAVLAINSPEVELGELVKTLHGMATTARSIEEKRIEKRESLVTAQAKRERLDHRITALCLEADASDPTSLKEAIRLSNQARLFEETIADEASRLRQIPGVKSVEDVERQAMDESQNMDTLAARLEAHEDQSRTLAEEREIQRKIVWESSHTLKEMNAGAGASGSQQEVQRLMGQLEEQVADYARLRLAEAVLRKAVDRYREQNQGPILEHTNRLFNRLTCGSFHGISPLDETPEPSKKKDSLVPKLQGLRAGENGLIVPLNGMSRGTADALYLAIRLATLEHHLTSSAHEPMPFIIDDILIQFDDFRSQAALRALGELSKKTQVLFFTHHHHLVQLAEAALGSNGFKLHELPGRPLAG